MGIIEFKFDIERDLDNIYSACKSEEVYGESVKIPKKFLEICKEDSSDVKEKLKNVQNVIYDSGFIEIYLNEIEKAWVKIENEYFLRLKKLINKEPVKKATGYITTIGKCPYNPEENSFMISFYSNLVQSLRSVGHELFHLSFHKYYFKDLEVKLGRKKAHDIKEAITTVILNEEFKDLWFSEDPGYLSHQELRNFILKSWREKKDFDLLIKKIEEYILLNERRNN